MIYGSIVVEPGSNKDDFLQEFIHCAASTVSLFYLLSLGYGACSPGNFCNLMLEMVHSRAYFGPNMFAFLFVGPWTGERGAVYLPLSCWIRHCSKQVSQKVKYHWNLSNGQLTLVLLNCLWVFFIHLKLELLAQYPASNEWKIRLLMKNAYHKRCYNFL